VSDLGGFIIDAMLVRLKSPFASNKSFPYRLITWQT
jgi:hypothetical protein